MKKRILAILLAVCCLVPCLSACGETSSDDGDSTPAPVDPDTSDKDDEESKEIIYQTVQNPVMASGADPWVVEHEGMYYYCGADGNKLMISKFSDLDGITLENRSIVYTAPEGTAYSANYWAPELHYLDGEWYIYVAADDGNNANHRMYVLKGTTQNPCDPFEMVGKISDSSDKWAIDGTVLTLHNEMYFIWSGWEGNENVAQNIYIAHMSDPCTIDSKRVMISAPTHSWEKVGSPYVNEGPTALVHDGRVFVLYSASGSWTDDYCLGMLTLVGDSPLNADSWEKSSRAVFKKRSGVAYGPGHCSFARAFDGSLWMIYHANLVSGSSWAGRSVWIAPVQFKEDGTPFFGYPSQTVQFPSKAANAK